MTTDLPFNMFQYVCTDDLDIFIIVIIMIILFLNNNLLYIIPYIGHSVIYSYI